MLTLTSREPNIMAFYSILLAFEQILKALVICSQFIDQYKALKSQHSLIRFEFKLV